jgi:hypothetical protein
MRRQMRIIATYPASEQPTLRGLLQRDGLYTRGVIVCHGIDARTHRISPHPGVVRLQQLGHVRHVAEPGVKPQVVVIRRQYDRHTIMDTAHCLVSGRGQDRAGLNDIPTGRSPPLPQPSEAKDLVIADFEAVGLFACRCALPFVKASRDNTAPLSVVSDSAALSTRALSLVRCWVFLL